MLVSGIVLHDGIPVANALVVAESDSGAVPEISAVTNFEGEFVLGLPPGKIKLRVQSDLDAFEPLSLDVGEDMEVEIHSI